MKSWIWLYLARRQMLDKSDITFVRRQKRLKLRQICHHICPRQMYNKCIINTTPYLLSDKYSAKLSKFEAENSDVLFAIYISLHWLLSHFSRANGWVWVFRAGLFLWKSPDLHYGLLARHVVERQLNHNMTFQVPAQKFTSLSVKFETLVTKGLLSYSAKSRTVLKSNFQNCCTVCWWLLNYFKE